MVNVSKKYRPLTKSAQHILPCIVIAQFCCTSLWFAGNGVMAELIANFELPQHALGHLTSAVQLGFITGTLLFAIFTLTDRFSPSKVFLVSAVLGAACNLGILWDGNSFTTIIVCRFLTGFFLAGIYPVGMKIAADHFDKGLGKSLSFLVGALVLGTALPHLLKGAAVAVPWRGVIATTSGLAVFGGLLIAIGVPDGPYRKASQQLQLTACFAIFREKVFRSAAFGYFGHMWELYTVWAFVPVMLVAYTQAHTEVTFPVSLLSFAIIAIGGLACVIGGYISQKLGEKITAGWALGISGSCCLLFPLMFILPYPGLFVAFLLFWGMTVIADSPLFSTLVAKNAPVAIKGTALTIVNCIGFAITIFSIQLVTYLQTLVSPKWLFLVLAVGPMFGLTALFKK